MAHKHRTLHDLAHHQLKDLHYAERHAGKLLGKMAKAASASAVHDAFHNRQAAFDAHESILDHLFDLLDKKPHGVPCEAMDGIVGETRALIDDFGDGPAIDAGLLAAAQAVEHYTLARYGALRLWLVNLGFAEAAASLDRLAAEGRLALEMWDRLATGVVPAPAAEEPVPFTLKQAALAGLR